MLAYKAGAFYRHDKIHCVTLFSCDNCSEANVANSSIATGSLGLSHNIPGSFYILR